MTDSAAKTRKRAPTTTDSERAHTAAVPRAHASSAVDVAGTRPDHTKKPRVAFRHAPITSLEKIQRKPEFPFPRIQQLLAELPICHFQYSETDADQKAEQDDLVAALRHSSNTQRLVLPVFTSAYESELLREAGVFTIRGRSVVFPACRFGNRCVGRATGIHAIPGLKCVSSNLAVPSTGAEAPRHTQCGVTLMSLLFEEEMQTLLATGNIDMTNRERPCILCYRHLLCDFMFALQPRHAAPMASTCIQIYSNLKVIRVRASYDGRLTGRGRWLQITVHDGPGADALQWHCFANSAVPAPAAVWPA